MACTDRADRAWKGHVLGPADEEGNLPTVVSHATRLEFQDGKQKQATQMYHGRDTLHSHSLDFLENVEAIGTYPAKRHFSVSHTCMLDVRILKHACNFASRAKHVPGFRLETILHFSPGTSIVVVFDARYR